MLKLFKSVIYYSIHHCNVLKILTQLISQKVSLYPIYELNYNASNFKLFSKKPIARLEEKIARLNKCSYL